VQAAATTVAAVASPVVSPIATVAAAASPAIATASPAAATAVAAASPAVATAVAGASPGATSVTAASPIRITGGQIGADTTITIQNTSTGAVDLTGWKLRAGATSVTLPGNLRLGPNETATIHTASGTSAGADIYLGQAATPLLSELLPGRSIALLDPNNALVAEFRLPG
jgi:hypothetical protein